MPICLMGFAERERAEYLLLGSERRSDCRAKLAWTLAAREPKGGPLDVVRHCVRFDDCPHGRRTGTASDAGWPSARQSRSACTLLTPSTCRLYILVDDDDFPGQMRAMAGPAHTAREG